MITAVKQFAFCYSPFAQTQIANGITPEITKIYE